MGIEHFSEKTSCSLPEERNPNTQQTPAGLYGSDMLHRERRQLQGEEEEEEEQAHSGCQPVSPRLHETLMDLIDW